MPVKTTTPKKTNVYFDAFPLATSSSSGVGHLIAETVRALDSDKAFLAKYNLVLIGPKSGFDNIRKWGFKNASLKAIPTKGRVWSALVLYRLLPPADLFFGKGIYIFANYTTWPLLFSKSIMYIHDLNFLANPDTVKPKTYKVLSKNIRLWVKRASRVATISEFSKSEIKKFLGVDASAVLYCGVDQKEFYPRPQKEIEAVKKKYGITGDYILFLSNVEPRKNIDRLLDAYALLNKNLRAKYAFVMVGGDGWLNEATKQRIAKLRAEGNSIIWPTDYVPDEDKPALISGAQVLAHPALYEGFGIPPLEALACGTPALVSNTTSLPEVASDVGIYVDPLDVDDISSKLTESLKLDKSLLTKSLIAQSAKFRWSTAASKLATLLDDLVK
jgi:glycosyltransferase involved in cell wall biosynthesis